MQTKTADTTQGWHGDTAGHQAAGRLGGLKRALNARLHKEQQASPLIAAMEFLDRVDTPYEEIA